MQLERLVKWKAKKVLRVLDQKGLRKCKIGVPHSPEGLGVGKGN